MQQGDRQQLHIGQLVAKVYMFDRKRRFLLLCNTIQAAAKEALETPANELEIVIPGYDFRLHADDLEHTGPDRKTPAAVVEKAQQVLARGKAFVHRLAEGDVRRHIPAAFDRGNTVVNLRMMWTKCYPYPVDSLFVAHKVQAPDPKKLGARDVDGTELTSWEYLDNQLRMNAELLLDEGDLVDYADCVAHGDELPCLMITPEMARLHHTGLTSTLLAGLRKYWPEEANAMGLPDPGPVGSHQQSAVRRLPLSERENAAYSILVDLSPTQAMPTSTLMEALARKGFPMDETTFRKEIKPALIPWGLNNRRRVGWYIERDLPKNLPMPPGMTPVISP